VEFKNILDKTVRKTKAIVFADLKNYYADSINDKHKIN